MFSLLITIDNEIRPAIRTPKRETPPPYKGMQSEIRFFGVRMCPAVVSGMSGGRPECLAVAFPGPDFAFILDYMIYT